MASTTATRMNIAAGFSTSLGNPVAALARGVRQFAVATKHRHELKCLVDLDDRMLADIGISRDDLRGALSGPFWRDPTALLASRVEELRADRHRRALNKAAQIRNSQPRTGA